MRESQLYLFFIKRNVVLLLIPAIIFSLIGYFYMLSRPVSYKLQRMFEVRYADGEVQEGVTLADEVVTFIRSENIKQSLGVEATLNAYKPGPLAIYLVAESEARGELRVGADLVTKILTSKYSVEQIGVDVVTKKMPSVYAGFLVGFVTGALIGLFLSLLREYFRTY